MTMQKGKLEDETQVKISSRKALISKRFVATRAEGKEKEYIVLEDMNTNSIVNSVEYEKNMSQKKIGKKLMEEIQ